MSQPPLDMLVAWLKPKHGLENLGVIDFCILLTLDMLGGLAQSQLKGHLT
jgi:hypothetical protein